jgi:uncharacterized protein (TIGR02284 family)
VVILDARAKLRRSITCNLKDEILRRYFAAESFKRSSFRGEIETLLHSEGDHDPEESGTVSGTLRRNWGDLKAHLGGSDHTLLETAEAGEDRPTEGVQARAGEGTAAASPSAIIHAVRPYPRLT